jgi:transposase
VVISSRRARGSQTGGPTCKPGKSGLHVARLLRVTPGTVTRWRGRFVAQRLEGLVDEPRPGRPASILLDQVGDVLVTTLEQAPPNTTHWSRTSMAARSGLSPSTSGRIWRRFELTPVRAAHRPTHPPRSLGPVPPVLPAPLGRPTEAVRGRGDAAGARAGNSACARSHSESGTRSSTTASRMLDLSAGPQQTHRDHYETTLERPAGSETQVRAGQGATREVGTGLGA